MNAERDKYRSELNRYYDGTLWEEVVDELNKSGEGTYGARWVMCAQKRKDGGWYIGGKPKRWFVFTSCLD